MIGKMSNSIRRNIQRFICLQFIVSLLLLLLLLSSSSLQLHQSSVGTFYAARHRYHPLMYHQAATSMADRNAALHIHPNPVALNNFPYRLFPSSRAILSSGRVSNIASLSNSPSSSLSLPSSLSPSANRPMFASMVPSSSISQTPFYQQHHYQQKQQQHQYPVNLPPQSSSYYHPNMLMTSNFVPQSSAVGVYGNQHYQPLSQPLHNNNYNLGSMGSSLFASSPSPNLINALYPFADSLDFDAFQESDLYGSGSQMNGFRSGPWQQQQQQLEQQSKQNNQISQNDDERRRGKSTFVDDYGLYDLELAAAAGERLREAKTKTSSPKPYDELEDEYNPFFGETARIKRSSKHRLY